MRQIGFAFGLCLLSSTAARDRPTALEVVNAIERTDGDADALAGAVGNYYTERFGFKVLKASVTDGPAGLNARRERFRAAHSPGAVVRRYR